MFSTEIRDALTLPAVRPVPAYSVRVHDGRVVLELTTTDEETT